MIWFFQVKLLILFKLLTCRDQSNSSTIYDTILNQNNYDLWLNVKQLNNYNVFQFIFYLSFLKFYLFAYMQYINFQMINKLKNVVKIEFRIEMSNRNFIKRNAIYEKFQNNIIKIEHDFKQKKIYWIAIAKATNEIAIFTTIKMIVSINFQKILIEKIVDENAKIVRKTIEISIEKTIKIIVAKMIVKKMKMIAMKKKKKTKK